MVIFETIGERDKEVLEKVLKRSVTAFRIGCEILYLTLVTIFFNK